MKLQLSLTMNESDAHHPNDTCIGYQESDCDDDDRREMIIHYANDKYLSKWDDDEAERNKPGITLNVLVPNGITGTINDAQEESGHLKASCDCDDVSLLSYNSFRDGTASVTPKTAPASLSYHAGQLPSAGGEELKLWQGYGGNIYFDAVRCQSMRINSSKSAHPCNKDVSGRCKAKSCIPSRRTEGDQVHTNDILRAPGDELASILHLGSLRMRSCKQRKSRPGDCGHKCTTRHLQGKICKGSSEKLLSEKIQKFSGGRGISIAKKPIVVSGGNVANTARSGVDPIGKAKQINNNPGFPALIADSSLFSHHQRNKTPKVVVSGDGNPFIKLPLMKKYTAKKARKPQDESEDKELKTLSEPSPVFIIPFGTFDDPVDLEYDGKQRVDKKENFKASSICRNSSLDKKKEVLSKQSSESDGELVSATENHHVEDNMIIFDENDNMGRSSTPETNAVGKEKAVKRGTATFVLKREISNLSLNNYLRAIPTQASKEQNPETSLKSFVNPKMSYTKRSQALPMFYMMNNNNYSMHRIHCGGQSSQRANASQIYGGYYSHTEGKEPKLFHAEISTHADRSADVKNDDGAQDTTRRSGNSGNYYRRSSRSSRIAKHGLVRANYTSRHSVTNQSKELSPTMLHPIRNSEKRFFPITGQQISRMSGIQNR